MCTPYLVTMSQSHGLEFLVKFDIFIILVAQQLTSSMLPFLQLLPFASLLRLLIRFHSFIHTG